MKKRITLRYHMTLDLVYAVIVYCISIVCSAFIAARLATIADGIWWYRFRLAVVIVTLIYLIIFLLIKSSKEKKRKVFIIQEDGEILFENKNVRYYRISRSIGQLIFNLCDLILYDESAKKIKKIKNVSIKIRKYL